MSTAARSRSLAMALLFATACGERGRVEGEGEYARKVAELIPRVEAATGLSFKRPPKVATRTQGEVRAFLTTAFLESAESSELEGKQQAYTLLGFLEPGTDLRRLFTDLLVEQVAGIYDPRTHTLYVVEGVAPEAVGITLTHELVHALQDQYLDLDSVQRANRGNDRAMAAAAAIEGQATFEQVSLLMGKGNLIEGLPGAWDMVRQQIRDNKTTMPRLAAAPMVIQETLLFPYLAGAEYARAFKQGFPRRAFLSDLPRSTEQVLHPNRFIAGTDPAPPRLALPRATGGTVTYENDLGEFETRLWLYQYGKDQASAGRGAMGWNGDAYQVVKTPKGNAIVWLTLWDSAVDAGEFFDLANEAIVERFSPKEYGKLGDRGRRYQEGGRILQLRPVTVEGIPGVLWIDAPAGTAVDLDASRVAVSRPR
ncbi:MAG: hypothetical protein HYX65_04190 [Gemmatimonadetes bacterium]|nr:hypothetical protein [Gemmatimonadota bacterium]